MNYIKYDLYFGDKEFIFYLNICFFFIWINKYSVSIEEMGVFFG